jgi:hypothetical protein
VKLPRRVVRLLTQPAAEWTRIAAERDDAAAVYTGHAIPLAAIPPLSMLAGIALAGGRFLGSAGVVTVLTAAAMTYAILLAMPFFGALALEQLAPRLKSDGSGGRAFALVAYASTPFWLGGVFYVLVQLWPLVWVGAAYAVYLVYVGCGIVTETPADQRLPLTLVTVIAVMFVNTGLRWIAQQAGIPTYGL